MWKWSFTDVNHRKIHWATNAPRDIEPANVPVLLFVHGFASRGEHWFPVANHLLERYRILIIDRPGYGKSGFPPCGSIEESADLIKEWLFKIGIQQPVVYAGHSLGGAIGLCCAVKYPQHFTALILAASFVRFKVNPILVTELGAGIYDSESIRMGFAKDAPQDLVENFIKEAQSFDIKAIRADLAICDEWDYRNEIPNIKLPALILASTEDRIVNFRQAELLKKELPNSKLEQVSNAGHNVIIEQPEKIVHDINLFIHEISGK